MISGKLSKKALNEAYEILKLLDDESLEKIPEKLLSAMEISRDKTYTIDITSLIEGNILEETKDILSAIYCEYLATPEEKKVIAEYLNAIETESDFQQETLKFGIPIDLFERKIEEKATNQQTVTLPDVAKKENVITFVINKIKNILRK